MNPKCHPFPPPTSIPPGDRGSSVRGRFPFMSGFSFILKLSAHRSWESYCHGLIGSLVFELDQGASTVVKNKRTNRKQTLKTLSWIQLADGTYCAGRAVEWQNAAQLLTTIWQYSCPPVFVGTGSRTFDGNRIHRGLRSI